MPVAQISNPAGVWGLTATNDQTIHFYKNGAASTLQHGDVVILDTSNMPNTVTTTTSAGSVLVVGVVSSIGNASVADATTYAIGASVPVCVHGVARCNIGALTVAASGILNTSTTNKAADDGLATQLGNLLGISLESQAAKDANNCIRAYIKP